LNNKLDKVEKAEAGQMIAGWVDEQGIQVLNVAGPRASKDPGIHDFVMGLLERVLKV